MTTTKITDQSFQAAAVNRKRGEQESSTEKVNRVMNITLELLKSGSGVELIKRANSTSNKIDSLLILAHKNNVNVQAALKLGVDVVIIDNSMNDRSVAMIDAIQSLNKQTHCHDKFLDFVDKKYSQARMPKLSGRELEVLTLVAEGYKNQDIALELGIARTTARDHVQHIMQRLDVTSRAAAAVKALRLGILQ